MNERLQRLAREAGYFEFNNWTYFDIDKFAQLIVQECMACSTWVGKMNTNSCEPIQTAHAINQRIKQRFGVEE